MKPDQIGIVWAFYFECEMMRIAFFCLIIDRIFEFCKILAIAISNHYFVLYLDLKIAPIKFTGILPKSAPDIFIPAQHILSGFSARITYLCLQFLGWTL